MPAVSAAADLVICHTRTAHLGLTATGETVRSRALSVRRGQSPDAQRPGLRAAARLVRNAQNQRPLALVSELLAAPGKLCLTWPGGAENRWAGAARAAPSRLEQAAADFH